MFILFIASLMMYLTHKFFDLKNLLNPFVFFYLYQTVFCFIALSYQDMYKLKIDLELQFYIIIAYLLTFIGGLLSKHLFQKSGIKYYKFNNISLGLRPSNAFLISGLVLFLIGILVFLYFTYKTGGVIIFDSEIENSRIEKRKGLGMINLLFMALFFYSFLVILISRKLSKGIKFLFFLFVAFAVSSFGNRAPLVKLLLSSFLLIGILSKKKYSIKKYILLGSIILLIVVSLGALRTNQAEGVSILRIMKFRLGWRPYVNIQNLQRIYDFFPDKHNFMLGYSYIQELKVFLPGHNPNFGTYLKEVMNWQFEGGSITPTFLGIGYLNFGKIAFFVYPFFFGFLFNSIYQLICYKKNVESMRLICLILFSIGISGSLSTGLLPAIISNIMFLIFVVILHIIIKQLMLKNID